MRGPQGGAGGGGGGEGVWGWSWGAEGSWESRGVSWAGVTRFGGVGARGCRAVRRGTPGQVRGGARSGGSEALGALEVVVEGWGAAGGVWRGSQGLGGVQFLGVYTERGCAGVGVGLSSLGRCSGRGWGARGTSGFWGAQIRGGNCDRADTAQRQGLA